LDGAYDGAPASNWLLEFTARAPAGSSKLFDVERSACRHVDVTVARIEIHQNAESVKAGPTRVEHRPEPVIGPAEGRTRWADPLE
jgi:hypothetical protein